MTADARALVDGIRARLREAADPARAAGQQAYMKSAMPFLGVRVPDARRIARAAAKGESDAATLRAAALELWDDAGHREERYAALALLGLGPFRGDPSIVPVVEHLVRTGRWWDYTDELAHRLADLHDDRPAETAVLVRRWLATTTSDPAHADPSKLGRAIGDAGIFADMIEPNLADREFFVRKAIGWVLREAARVAGGCADTHDQPAQAARRWKHS